MQSHELGFLLTLCPTSSGERLIRGYTEFDSTVDEGKGRLNPSCEKNEGKHRKRKVDEKFCVTFLLCDPGWCVHKPDVQNKWDDDTHTHTHTNTCMRFFYAAITGCGKETRGVYYLVYYGDLPRQHSFGTTLRLTGPVPADSRQ